MQRRRHAGYDTEYGYVKGNYIVCSRRYDFQANMTWAIETGTLQYIEGQVIGMSVLGGNLLIIGQDGLMRLAWENQEAPLVCGLYTHSIVF